jgi:RimJ/RimL family protein N-acetyltransferase
MTFTYKPATEDQRPLIHQWLAQEHIKEWFPGQAAINTLEDLDQFYQGPSIFQHWVAYDGQTPIGYMLTSKIIKDPAARDIYAKWCLQEGDAITLDHFICDPAYLNEESGTKLINDFLNTQFATVTEVFADPEVANSRTVQIYRNVGFEVFDEFNAAWHPVPHYRMRLKRTIKSKSGL